MGQSRQAGGGIDRRAILAGATTAAAASMTTPLGTAMAAAATGPLATTAYGRVRGYHDGPVKVFKGVPYGAPTGGANRWLPSKPPQTWTGVRDCRRPGPMSPQTAGAPLAEETAMLQVGPMSEDCLNLNVFTPQVGRTSGKRPVMVWFHGGAYSNGSANATPYDGRNLAEKHDVVLVTVTHRLNTFGFLYLADLFGPDYAQSGNVGILDCVAALRWVRDNIAYFGGDPGLVTIFGQSGGAGKVSTLMAMPSAKGLFHRAIVQSGSAERGMPKAAAAENAKRLVDALGVKTIAELQALPADRFIAAASKAGVASAPVVDGDALPHDPFFPNAPETARDIPLLTGSTETEMTFFPLAPLDSIDDAKFRDLVKGFMRVGDSDVDALIEAFRKANPGKDDGYLFQLMSSQATFTDGVITQASRKADQKGAPVFVYYFTKHTPVRDGKLRAPHTVDIPFAFDSLAHAAPIIGPVTVEKQALADKVSACWAAFARTGNPNNPKIPHWPAYNTTARPTMEIDDAFKAVDDPLHGTRLALAAVKGKGPGPAF